MHPSVGCAAIKDNTFFDLQVYVPRLVSQQEGWRASIASSRIRYPYILLESSVSPSSLVTQLSPWLQATKQGMWIRQLPLAEQTVCLGWLLFSAPEYDGSELQRIIKEISGEEVALRYRSIQKGTRGSPADDKPIVKAIHVEMDTNLSPKQRQRITSIYSASATTFPLDIKMRLVPECSDMSKTNTPARALMLRDRQARFLLRSATSKLSLDSQSNLTMSQVTDFLRSMSCAYLVDKSTVTPLFHAVSPMVRAKGCLIRYLPQHRPAVLETLAQLQTLLPCFQAPLDNTSLSSTSGLPAGWDANSSRPSSQQTRSKANAREGLVLDQRMPSTTELAPSTHSSSVNHPVTNAHPQPRQVGLCTLTQVSIQPLDLLYSSSHSRSVMLDVSSTRALLPSPSKSLPSPR